MKTAATSGLSVFRIRLVGYVMGIEVPLTSAGVPRLGWGSREWAGKMEISLRMTLIEP